MQPGPGHSIPIPIPSMGSGQAAHSIHINNFTANLNYQAAMPLPPGQEAPAPGAGGYPGHHYPAPAHFMGQYELGPAHYPAPLVFLPQPLHPAYHPHHLATPPGPAREPEQPQQQQMSYSNGAGITFGSTPVVSIRSGARNSETEESLPDPPPPVQTSFPQPPIVKSPPREIHQQQQPPQQQQHHQPPAPQLQPQTYRHHPDPAVAPGVPTALPTAMAPAAPRDAPVAPLPPATPSSVPVVGDSVKADSGDGNQAAIVTNNHQECQPTMSSKVDPVQAEPTAAVEQMVKSPEPVAVETKVSSNPDPDVLSPNPDASGGTDSTSTAPAAVEEVKESVGSWASLFASKTAGVHSDSAALKPTARIQPFTASEVSDSNDSKDVNTADIELGKFLKYYTLKHVSASLLPRGLLNRSNWCFVNAILQALLACPPFYNMMKSLSTVIHPLKQSKSKTPMLDSMVEFISEFSVLETQQLNKPQKKDKNRKKDDIVTGISLEPMYVYNMLLNLEDETFKVVDGRQEDAEEFLSCLLNGLSDEMSGKIKLVEEEQPANDAESYPEGDDADDDWKEVGAKGRSCVTRRVADSSQVATPIQSLALGLCRSCVRSEAGDNSATLQPFYTLQLDIQDDSIRSVGDALAQNFASEKLDGFVCSKTKKEIEATRSLSLEELPPLLILHLKRFVYDPLSGGVQKCSKQIDFSVDLEIPKSLLSPECRASTKQRQYKLFSVVYHNGREATKVRKLSKTFNLSTLELLNFQYTISEGGAYKYLLIASLSALSHCIY